ncbi:MAG: DUF3300 domain-containing protein [Acidobacteriota bacterium]|nr:DUF3300 domain-containing protein [Acidobacteriota bacterium]
MMAVLTTSSGPGRRAVAMIAIAAVIVQLSGVAFVRAQEPAAATDEAPAAISPEELDSLVAPIALYPDPLLAQVLVASTYPLELIQLQQWLGKNSGIEGDALAEAVAEQPWDPSVQSMAAVPDAANRLADDIQWTTALGNAFLAQQGDVMDAVQRMRKKAQDNGALESNEQQVVETEVVEEKTVIVVQSAQPEVIYVPTYSPTVVYGPPPVYYPYPPIYYPPYRPGGAFVAFSVGVAWGAAIWGGSCCRCGWGRNNININVNNNFNRNTNINRGGGGNWQHNPQHRGGTPYANKATASKYGGSARGDSLSSRQANARQQGGAANRAGSAGASNRAAGAGTANRAGSAGASNRAASAGTANRAGSAGPSAATRGGADRIGSRSIPSSGGRSTGGFGGGSSGFNGASARSAGSRGASSARSMGSRGGGGRRR